MSETTDDMDFYPDQEWMNNEQNWKQGYHVDQYDDEHLFEDMDDRYLLNVIRHFSKWDTKPLLREAKKRGLIIK